MEKRGTQTTADICGAAPAAGLFGQPSSSRRAPARSSCVLLPWTSLFLRVSAPQLIHAQPSTSAWSIDPCIYRGDQITSMTPTVTQVPRRSVIQVSRAQILNAFYIVFLSYLKKVVLYLRLVAQSSARSQFRRQKSSDTSITIMLITVA